MSSILIITKQITSEITASVTPGGSLPLDIFVYENAGNGTLGKYIGVCDIDEYQRIQPFTGANVPVFGNRYLRYTSVKILIDLNNDTTKVTDNLTNTVKNLSTGFANAATTTISVPIP
jgi:hypothetical protein